MDAGICVRGMAVRLGGKEQLNGKEGCGSADSGSCRRHDSRAETGNLEGLGSLGSQAGAAGKGKQGGQAREPQQQGIREGGRPASKGCECCSGYAIPLPGPHSLNLPQGPPLQAQKVDSSSGCNDSWHHLVPVPEPAQGAEDSVRTCMWHLDQTAACG